MYVQDFIDILEYEPVISIEFGSNDKGSDFITSKVM